MSVIQKYDKPHDSIDRMKLKLKEMVRAIFTVSDDRECDEYFAHPEKNWRRSNRTIYMQGFTDGWVHAIMDRWDQEDKLKATVVFDPRKDASPLLTHQKPPDAPPAPDQSLDPGYDGPETHVLLKILLVGAIGIVILLTFIGLLYKKG